MATNTKQPWEPKFETGQQVEYIAKTALAEIGQKAIVAKPINYEYYKTVLLFIDENGKLTGKEETIFNSMISDKVKEIEEKVDLSKIEIAIGEIGYVEEKEVEDQLAELKDYSYETVMSLSQIELKVLISLLTGFHPKYIDNISIKKYVENSEVYQIDFTVKGFVYESCFLIYEEGYFDLDFK